MLYGFNLTIQRCHGAAELSNNYLYSLVSPRLPPDLQTTRICGAWPDSLCTEPGRVRPHSDCRDAADHSVWRCTYESKPCEVTFLDPPLHLPSRPVLDRLGQVLGLDVRRPLQIRDRPRELEDPVKRPRTHAQLGHRRAQQRLPRAVQITELPHLGRPHIRVAHERSAGEARSPKRPGRLHSLPDRRAGLSQAVIRQLVVRPCSFARGCQSSNGPLLP